MKKLPGFFAILKMKGWLLLCSCFFLISCLKNKDTTANGPKARITVGNYVVNSAAFNILYDAGALTTAPLAYGKSFDSGYIPVGAGIHNLTITSGTDVIASNSISVQTGISYSLFLYDTLKNKTVKAWLVEDIMVAVDTVAKARFLQFIPLPANDSLTFRLTNNLRGYEIIDAFVGNKSAPGNGSDFFANLQPGTYQVQLLRKNLPVPVIYTLPSYTVERGRLYTFIAKGTVNGTGEYAIGLNVVKNN